MIKSELVQRIAEHNPHLYQRDVENIVNAILDEIVAALARGEGIGALYRGLPANIIGIMPEKTIKLAGNDFFRQQFQVGSKSHAHNETRSGLLALFAGRQP